MAAAVRDWPDAPGVLVGEDLVQALTAVTGAGYRLTPLPFPMPSEGSGAALPAGSGAPFRQKLFAAGLTWADVTHVAQPKRPDASVASPGGGGREHEARVVPARLLPAGDA